jgi:uncharacterized protein (TIGR03083 family)
METRPAPWITALRNSHDRLRAVVEPLSADQITGPSYAKDWSIAQVLSHLGSGAEIFGMFLAAGLAGEQPPGNEAFGPIWEAWNAKSPQDQVADGLRSDAALVEKFEALTDQQRAELRLALFGMDNDAAGMARMRLSEHAVHTWDVAVALDPEQTIAPEAVGLLIDGLSQLAAWTGKKGGPDRKLSVATTGPEREFALATGEQVSLDAADGEAGTAEGAAGTADLRLPAEALIRLVYGRLDPDHTPPLDAKSADLDELRATFPGM